MRNTVAASRAKNTSPLPVTRIMGVFSPVSCFFKNFPRDPEDWWLNFTCPW